MSFVAVCRPCSLSRGAESLGRGAGPGTDLQLRFDNETNSAVHKPRLIAKKLGDAQREEEGAPRGKFRRS